MPKSATLTKSKRKRALKAVTRLPGRPVVTDREIGQRYQIYIRPSQAAHLLALGDGSLSAGIVLALQSHENAPSRASRSAK